MRNRTTSACSCGSKWMSEALTRAASSKMVCSSLTIGASASLMVRLIEVRSMTWSCSPISRSTSRAQAHERQVQLLRDGLGNLLLARQAHVHQQLAEQLARAPLLRQGLVQLLGPQQTLFEQNGAQRLGFLDGEHWDLPHETS